MKKAKVIPFPQKKKAPPLTMQEETMDHAGEMLDAFGAHAFFPEGEPTPCLFLVEGRESGEAIESHFHATAIALRDRSRTLELEGEIEKVSSMTHALYPSFTGYSTLYVALEGNLLSRYKRFEQMRGVTDRIKGRFPNLSIAYLQWSGGRLQEWLGKEGLRFHKKEEFEERVDKGVKALMETYGVDTPSQLHPQLLKGLGGEGRVWL